jgi:PPIC-type PPIASE domain
MNDSPSTTSRWLREPLLHFLLLGALLFLVFQWRGGSGPEDNRIVITPGQIDSMAATFARTWQRPPTEDELKGLIDDYVREEMATREALAVGLDRGDKIIRRRLRQKLEFVIEDAIDSAPLTEMELQAWLERHPDRFRTDPEVTFRQVYLSPERRGGSIAQDAQILVAKLSAAGKRVDLSTVGDSLMLPVDVERSTRTDVARQFGDEFADEILKIEPGRWAGPIRSGYGFHLVLVEERKDGRSPILAEIRPLVEREVRAERRKQRLDDMYEEMLSRYRIVVEKRPVAAQKSNEAAARVEIR